MSFTTKITHLCESVNFHIPGGRWQLFEFCDLALVPNFIKHCCQDTLTAQWTYRLPVLQRCSPAELAADTILQTLAGLKDIDEVEWQIIDFCSGSGGPVPVIESLVNRRRQSANRPAIRFRLSDLYPNIDAWIAHAARSDYLSFVPQPVDASNPPFAVLSRPSTSNADEQDALLARGLQSDGSKVFRLFCLSFHHFDDAAARRVLKSTLATSDAFAIIELQERRLGSLVIMLLEFLLLWLVTVFWFPHDLGRGLLTYVVPVLPAVHSFDGLVSCLRTRTFGETIRLVEEVQGAQKLGESVFEGNAVLAQRGEWLFEYSRRLHTWPLGYMNVISGKKV